MTVWKYPKEIYEYISKNAKSMTDKEIANSLNERYKEYDFTPQKVKSYRKNHKIRTGRKGGNKKGRSLVYPDGLEEFVRANALGKTTQELTNLINAKFGAGTITESKTRAYKKNHKIKSGVDCKFKKGVPAWNKGIRCEMPKAAVKYQFKKGHKPHNFQEKGTISKTTDGYMIIKISNKGTQRERWEPLHRYVWQKEKGEIPPGKMITFLDGNKENCDIENLELIDNEINLEMQRRKLRAHYAEITKVGINVAKLAQLARKKKKQNYKKVATLGKHETSI